MTSVVSYLPSFPVNEREYLFVNSIISLWSIKRTGRLWNFHILNETAGNLRLDGTFLRF